MRIDRLRLQNFKRFEDYPLDLHPRFTLLVGDNGAGKTTILDALAVAAGIWLVKPPDSMLANSGRNIVRNEFVSASGTRATALGSWNTNRCPSPPRASANPGVSAILELEALARRETGRQ